MHCVTGLVTDANGHDHLMVTIERSLGVEGLEIQLSQLLRMLLSGSVKFLWARALG